MDKTPLEIDLNAPDALEQVTAALDAVADKARLEGFMDGYAAAKRKADYQALPEARWNPDLAAKLAADDDAGFMNAVALRAAPQREKPPKATPKPATAEPREEEPVSASPFAKLLGKFGRS